MTEEKKPIQVKLTEEQRALLDAAAEARGLKTSSYMRAASIEAAHVDLKRRAPALALQPDEG